MSITTDASVSPSPNDSGVNKPVRVYSCTSCQHRKVRCDKKQPCSGCVKAGLQCIRSTPAPPQRRTRKLSEVRSQMEPNRSLRGDGHNIEGSANWDLGQSMEVVISDDFTSATRRRLNHSASNTREGSRPSKEPRTLIVGHKAARFLENNLWTGLSDEFQDPRELPQRSDEDDKLDSSFENVEPDGSALLFESSSHYTNFKALHPPPALISRLWQTFRDNVNTLSKILHAPTVQHQILEASSCLDKISNGLQALMFAIYAMAVLSLTNAQCINMTGEERSTLLAKYQNAAQQALIEAGFLRSPDMTLLQAYTLFLLSIRQSYNLHSVWILTGVAVRIGRRLKLHRDGDTLALSPFETEMRRRLWWQIVLLDSHSAQLSGSEALVYTGDWDTKVPSNLNDSDLDPEMKEMPAEHVGATEMILCLIRYEFREYFQGSASTTAFDNQSRKGKVSSTEGLLRDKDRSINDLENRLETKYLRYCDPLIPLHVVSAALARSSICKMRLLAHHPRQYPDKGVSLPQEEKDMLFATSLKMIEYDTLCQSTPTVRKFLWHLNVYFQLDAFVFMLSELRTRTAGQLAENAWEQVHEVYHYHPNLISNTKNTLYVAIGNLTLRVWELREEALRRQIQTRPEIPPYITALQLQRNGSDRPETLINPVNDGTSISFNMLGIQQLNDQKSPSGVAPAAGLNDQLDTSFQFDPLPMDSSPVDWDYWNYLLEANELATAEDNGQQLFG